MGKIYLNDINYSGGGGGGSTVRVSPLLNTGIPIANITVNGVVYTLYAPPGSTDWDLRPMTIRNGIRTTNINEATGEVNP